MSKTVLRILCLGVSVALVSACGITNIGFRDTKAKTKVTKRGNLPVRPLEMPPELIPPSDEPPRSSFLASQSGEVRSGPAATTGTAAAPRSTRGRSYIKIGAPPQTVQLQVLSFWRNMGVPLAKSDPRTGTVETEWVRDYANQTFGANPDENSMDRFTIVIQQGDQPSTSHVYLRHEGRQSQSPDQAAWKDSPSNPRIEALMLERLQAFLSV